MHYLGDRPVAAELGKVYFEGYGPYQADGAPQPAAAGLAVKVAGPPLRVLANGLERLRPDRLQARLDAFYRPAAPGRVLLDYGCGSTAFLDIAAAAGWSTIGADFSPAILASIAEHGHRGVLVGEQLRAEVADASVDCARMNHVVEHLYEPGQALRDIRSKLRDGGRIHISTPNPAALGARLFGTRWFDLDCPRHATLFAPLALRELVLACGFRDVTIVDEVVTKNLARSWGIVKFERGRIGHGEIYGLGADPRRAHVLSPVAKLAALTGRADRFHLFAAA